jgi:hypothetical protein
VKSIGINSLMPLASTYAWGHSTQSVPTTRLVHLLGLINSHCFPQGPQFPLGFTLGVVHCMDLGLCIMTRTHHCCVTQNTFTVLNLLCSAFSSLPLLLAPATIDLYTFVIVLPFLEYHRVVATCNSMQL